MQNFQTITGALFGESDLSNTIALAKQRRQRRETILTSFYMRQGLKALPALEKAQEDLNEFDH